MTLKKFLCFASLLFTAAATPVFAQYIKVTQVQRSTDSDPFKLTPGTSFSASGSGNSKPSTGMSKEIIASDFDAALEIVRKNHANGSALAAESLTSSAITSMLKTLDPHSNYYGSADYQDLLGEHESEYSGTGSSIAGFLKNGSLEVYIVSTFPGSPAARAGLRFGDRIIAVNGKNILGLTPDIVRDAVRGKRGTLVRLTVERSDTKATETIELKRDRVHEPAVPAGYILKPGVGYIDLTGGFSNATIGELETALKDLHRQGMTSLVMDIRGNGGGILDQAVKVAERFLPAGSTIVSQRGRYPDDTRTWKAGKSRHETMPMVLLVDENSASASEVLAGAFQDNDRAIIIGEKTFGKGLVQSVLSLPYGSGLTLTAARYYTPSGRSIQRDYADVGLYDYFNHRNQNAEIERSVYAARTITNRVVYGGDGITPDETAKKPDISTAQMALLDPLFFFAREFAAGRIEGRQLNSLTVSQQIRQQIVFGEQTVSENIIKLFAEFVSRENGWKTQAASLENERVFTREMLRYNLAMAAFGIEAANRARIETDPEVLQAIEALPKAARLATAAKKARSIAPKEKGSLSLVLNEQR